MPKPKAQTWSRDGYLISTDPRLIPLATLNDAFASPFMHWATRLPESELRTMVDNSLCFGLYSPTSLPPPGPDEESRLMEGGGIGKEGAAEVLHEIAGHVRPSTESSSAAASVASTSAPPTRPAAPSRTETETPNLIGFARLLTDHVTFTYLTDVYILPPYRGQRLGEWLIGCVQETIEAMPHLRRSMMLTGGGERELVGWYGRVMKMRALDGGEEYKVLEWKGRGNVF